MSQGIRGFYQVTKTLEDQLLLDENCKTVTTGDISKNQSRKTGYLPFVTYLNKQCDTKRQ